MVGDILRRNLVDRRVAAVQHDLHFIVVDTHHPQAFKNPGRVADERHAELGRDENIVSLFQGGAAQVGVEPRQVNNHEREHAAHHLEHRADALRHDFVSLLDRLRRPENRYVALKLLHRLLEQHAIDIHPLPAYVRNTVGRIGVEARTDVSELEVHVNQCTAAVGKMRQLDRKIARDRRGPGTTRRAHNANPFGHLDGLDARRTYAFDRLGQVVHIDRPGDELTAADAHRRNDGLWIAFPADAQHTHARAKPP